MRASVAGFALGYRILNFGIRDKRPSAAGAATTGLGLAAQGGKWAGGKKQATVSSSRIFARKTKTCGLYYKGFPACNA
jgi:hypothetical protein